MGVIMANLRSLHNAVIWTRVGQKGSAFTSVAFETRVKEVADVI